MNRAVVRDFLVGLTAILGVAGLVVMLMLFGELRKGLERVYPVKISMPDASGISGTSPVLFNGVRVGTITKLEVADPPTDGMIATLAVDRGVKIPRDLAVSVETRFIGDSALALGFADNADRSQYIGESEYAAGGIVKPIRVVPRTLFGDLKKPIEQLSATATKFEKFADTYTKLGESLQGLLGSPKTTSDMSMSNPSGGGKEPVTIADLVARADTTLAAMQTWLNDEQLLASIKDSTNKLGTLLDEAKSAAKSIDDAAKGIDTKAERAAVAVENLTKDAKATLAKLDTALADAGEIAAKINRGDGTAGQLVNNPDLYRSLNGAAERLDKALAELQLVLQKFKQEGIKVGL